MNRIEAVGLSGVVAWQLFGPDGELLSQGEVPNLITDTGDQYYAWRGAGTTTGPGAVATGMRLGTGTTAASKSGAGAAIGTYVNNSQRPLDSITPSSKGAGLGGRVAYLASWGGGVATANNISEVVITNETPLTNVAGSAATCLSRALLNPVVNKGANDTLAITWYHDLLAA